MDALPPDVTIGACGVVISVVIARRRRRKRDRKVWVHEWIRERLQQGAYYQLLQELRLSDVSSCCNFLRMDADTFVIYIASTPSPDFRFSSFCAFTHELAKIF